MNESTIQAATRPGADDGVFAGAGARPEARLGAAPGRHPRVTLFSIAFRSRMTAANTDRLRHELELVTQLTPKPGASGASPGVVRLDHWSGLFLEHGEREDEWLLEARTWGNPHPSTIRSWHLGAALAARQLDPAVPVPTPRPLMTTPARTASAARTGRARSGRRDPLLPAVLELIRGVQSR